MLRPWLFVGFTGHRNLDDPALIARAVREALQHLALRTHAPLATVSSAASGADTIFAEAAIEQGLPWTLLLPFPAEEFRKDFADAPDDWARVERLLPNAVRTVIEPPTDERSDAYLEAGVRTVDECDVLLAVWNGEPAAGRGGTADIVDYARAQEKAVWWIHATTGERREERPEAIPEPVAPPKSHANVSSTDRGTPTSPTTARSASPAFSETGGRATLDATFQFHTTAAKGLRPRAVNLNLSLVLLHQVSAAITLTALLWYDQLWLQGPSGWIKTALLVGAFVLPWFFQRAHGDWLKHRLHAEIFRSARTVWELPNPEEIYPALRLPAAERIQRSILLLRHLTPASAPPPTLDGARTTYDHQRLAGQLDYFQHQAVTAGRQQYWLTRLGAACTFTAIFLGFAPTFGLWSDADSFAKPLQNLGLVLPLVTTALLSTVAARDLKRRAARYGELAALLRRARTQLHNARTWRRLTRVVIDVERTLLLEIWEWYSLARFAPK
jgi:hypothetical protein